MFKIQNTSSNYWIIKIYIKKLKKKQKKKQNKNKGNMIEMQEVTLKIQTYCSIFQSQ